MSRTTKEKSLINTHLATNYGGWMYCDNCQENIGYLCYATYDEITFNYECRCGSKGSIHINFTDSEPGKEQPDDLIIVKNRLCCHSDQSPLITILDKKLAAYDLEITCKTCHQNYQKHAH